MRSRPELKSCSTVAGSGRTSPDRRCSLSKNNVDPSRTIITACLPAPLRSHTIRVLDLRDSFGGIFMSAIRSSHVQLGLLFATTLSLLMWPVAAGAYTAEQQQACSDVRFACAVPRFRMSTVSRSAWSGTNPGSAPAAASSSVPTAKRRKGIPAPERTNPGSRPTSITRPEALRMAGWLAKPRIRLPITCACQ
jgi:hypothetical protein